MATTARNPSHWMAWLFLVLSLGLIGEVALRWLCDMRDLDLGTQFSIVLIPFRPFQHLLAVSDQIAALQVIHRVAAVYIADQYSEVELIYYVRGADGITQRLVHGFLMRWYWRYELEHLLARCNFRVKAIFGDYNRSPLTDESSEMIFIAEPT